MTHAELVAEAVGAMREAANVLYAPMFTADRVGDKETANRVSDLITRLRTAADALAGEARDGERMKALDALLEGADFAYGEFENRHVVLLHLPDGIRIGASLADFADAVIAKNARDAARAATEGKPDA